MSRANMPTEKEIRAYYVGLIEGVCMFAHWRDGVQYVGTTGKTLEKAIEEINAREDKALEDFRYYS